MGYIMLHGMGQNASSWDKTISFLPKGTETVCPELRSFFGGEKCDYVRMYANFCSYCNEFSGQLDLCGLSLGAVLALNYTVDFPQKVKSLILIAPQFDMPKLLLKFQNVIFKLMPESAFKDMGMSKNELITLTNSMADIDLSGRLDRLGCPILIICGEKDKANKKAANKLVKAVSGAVYKEIKGSGHEVNMDNPQGLAKVISDWNT